MQKPVFTESTAVTKHKGKISLTLQDILVPPDIKVLLHRDVDMLNLNIAILFIYAKNVSFYFWFHKFY